MSRFTLAMGTAVVAIVIAITACFIAIGASQASSLAGAVGTRYPDGLAVGSTSPTRYHALVGASGTNFLQLNGGTCSLTLGQGNTSFTVTASTSAAFDCSTTGVNSNDALFAILATSSNSTGGGWEVESASASTTANSTRLMVRNNTGTNNIIPASVASSTVKWFSFRL